VAAEFSGYAGKFRCFFREEPLKTVCLDSFILKRVARSTVSIQIWALRSRLENSQLICGDITIICELVH
jgi:hypothetical protein